MMDRPPVPPDGVSSQPVFTDGFGPRWLTFDFESTDAVEIVSFDPSLAEAPDFASTLGNRAARLANARHSFYAHVRRLDRPSQHTLHLVSDHVPGWRLSELLDVAERHRLTIDISAVLGLLRQLIPAVALFARHQRDLAIGAIGPERLIVTPHARLVVAEYVLGPAIEKLQYSRERLWRELRVAVPASAGLARITPRADVIGIGIVTLSLLVGRRLRDDEYPFGLVEMVRMATESSGGLVRPLSDGLSSWLSRALQLDGRTGFLTPQEAQVAFEELLAMERGYVTSPAVLDALIARFVSLVGPPPEPVPPTLPPPAPAPPPPPPPRPEPQPVSSSFGASAPPPAASASTVTTTAPASPASVVPPSSHTPAPATPGSGAFPKPSFAQPAAPGTGAFPKPSFAQPAALEPPARPPDPGGEFDLSQLHAAMEASAKPAPVAMRPDLFGVKLEPETEPSLDAPREPTGLRQRFAGMLRQGQWPTAALAVCVVVALVEAVAIIWLLNRGGGSDLAGEGELVVSSRPAAARVSIDGEDRGATPLTVRLSPGTHVLEVRVGRSEPRVIPLQIRAGVQTAQYLELQSVPTVGALEINSDPPKARVTVDGQPRGVTPLVVRDLPPGEHEVFLEGQGRKVRQVIRIEAGVTAQLVVPMGAQ